MSRRAFSDADRLLHDLLDRHEAKPGASRLVAYVDEDGFRCVADRDRFLTILKRAHEAGAIALRTRRLHGETALAHVSLANADALYAFVSRAPSSQRINQALAGLRCRSDLPEGAGELLDEVGSAWSRNVTWTWLLPGDVSSLADSLTLAMALARAAGEPENSAVDYRTFSRRAGADSKALERLLHTVRALHSRLFGAGAGRDLDAEDYLASLGVLRMPQPLLVSGRLSFGHQALPHMLYQGIPPEQADELHVATRPEYVLTIENYTSFIRHVREVNTGGAGLVLYTGGFPARSHLRQIVRLAKDAGSPVFHWGDIDAGGLRIFQHLEAALAADGMRLHPHLMSCEILKRSGVPGEQRVRGIPASAEKTAVGPLWHTLVETDLILEQETVEPALPGGPA